jgi:hypothetical protein
MVKTTDENFENLAPPPGYGCIVCGERFTLTNGEKILSVHEHVNNNMTSERFYHPGCYTASVPARYRSEQLDSQIGATQGPWSSVELHKNSKGFTHDIKVYFPPDWTAEQVQERLADFQRVIEKLESIGSEGRHELE